MSSVCLKADALQSKAWLSGFSCIKKPQQQTAVFSVKAGLA
jgi:hypothetical protein